MNIDLSSVTSKTILIKTIVISGTEVITNLATVAVT